MKRGADAEAFGGGFITPLLHQDVEFGAMFVYRTPQQVRFTSQRDEHLVEVLRATGLAPLVLLVLLGRTEFSCIVFFHSTYGSLDVDKFTLLVGLIYTTKVLLSKGVSTTILNSHYPASRAYVDLAIAAVATFCAPGVRHTCGQNSGLHPVRLLGPGVRDL